MFNPNDSILAGSPHATLQCWLKDAQQAYAELASGQKAVTVSYDGKSVTYSAAQSGSLTNWIELLQRQLGIRSRGRRAIRPYFR
jgi:hypothetical protein